MLTTTIAVTSLFPLRRVVTATSTMSIAFLLLQLVFPHASSNFPSPLHPVLLCFTTSLGKVLDRTRVTLLSTMTQKYRSYANDKARSAHEYYRPVFPSLIWLRCPIPPGRPACEGKWMIMVKVHTCTPVRRTSPPPQLFIHIGIGRVTTDRTRLRARFPSKNFICSCYGLKAGVPLGRRYMLRMGRIGMMFPDELIVS